MPVIKIDEPTPAKALSELESLARSQPVGPSSTAPKEVIYCDRCGKIIPAFITPELWQERILCPACRRRFATLEELDRAKAEQVAAASREGTVPADELSGGELLLMFILVILIIGMVLGGFGYIASNDDFDSHVAAGAIANSLASLKGLLLLWVAAPLLGIFIVLIRINARLRARRPPPPPEP